jgi:hypothetical protein
MSRFTVSVELRYKKFTPIQIEEQYDNWADADKAWCAYRALVGLDSSCVVHTELIEHRNEIVHKHAAKPGHRTAKEVVAEIVSRREIDRVNG